MEVVSVVSFFISGVDGWFLVFSVMVIGSIFLWIDLFGEVVCICVMEMVRWCGVV